MEISDCWPAVYAMIAKGDIQNAITLCEQEPCSGSIECQRFLGWSYYKQDDMEKALSWFSKVAQREDGEAFYGIGSVYFIRRDFPLALLYFERAVTTGYHRAYGWIGYMHHQGLGVPRDIKLARVYYEKAASYGYLAAKRALLHLNFQYGNFFSKIASFPKLLFILLMAGILASRNKDDFRLTDIHRKL